MQVVDVLRHHDDITCPALFKPTKREMCRIGLHGRAVRLRATCVVECMHRRRVVSKCGGPRKVHQALRRQRPSGSRNVGRPDLRLIPAPVSTTILNAFIDLLLVSAGPRTPDVAPMTARSVMPDRPAMGLAPSQLLGTSLTAIAHPRDISSAHVRIGRIWV